MRLLQFLGSHFNATRLGSPHTEKVFIRLLNATLDGLKHSTGHPLAREIRFQIVLFGLRVLRFSIGVEFGARCLLKDKILSSALSWFSFPPRWSFGGNRLQLKAETRLLSDVSAAIRNVQVVADKPGPLLKTMQAKERLLQLMIGNEISRLAVWLYPITSPQESYLSNLGARETAEVRIPGPIRTRSNME
jgi:phosphatidylinositol 4-kinase A